MKKQLRSQIYFALALLVYGSAALADDANPYIQCGITGTNLSSLEVINSATNYLASNPKLCPKGSYNITIYDSQVKFDANNQPVYPVWCQNKNQSFGPKGDVVCTSKGWCAAGDIADSNYKCP